MTKNVSVSLDLVEAKRQRLDNPQHFDDTAPLEEVQLAAAASPIVPFARLRPLKTFVSQIDLHKDVTVCGRSPDADVTVGDHQGNPPWEALISKKHFEIIHNNSEPRKFFIKDTSLNGTYVNTVKLTKNENFEIKYGDVISFGASSTLDYDIFIFSDLTAAAVYPPALTKDYIMTGVILGKGGYGQVELGRERKNCNIKCAVKGLQKDHFFQNCNRHVCKAKDIQNEVDLMMKIEHPNIVRFLNFIDMEDSAYIILEFVGGGELFERIIDPRWDAKGMGQSLGRFYAYQLISAIQYLHSQGITHRDIKPENILLLEKEDYTIAKLSDFGLAKSKAASTMKTYCGTPVYIAPEIIDGERTPYREYVDVWSLGVVLFTTYSGYPPFSCEYDDMPLKEQIKEGRLILLKHWQNVSQNDQVAIKRMLSVNPLRRPTAKELLSMDWMHSPEAVEAKRKVEEYQLKRPFYQPKKPTYFTRS